MERLDLINHIKWCANELTLLLKKFEDLERFGHGIRESKRKRWLAGRHLRVEH